MDEIFSASLVVTRWIEPREWLLLKGKDNLLFGCVTSKSMFKLFKLMSEILIIWVGPISGYNCLNGLMISKRKF